MDLSFNDENSRLQSINEQDIGLEKQKKQYRKDCLKILESLISRNGNCKILQVQCGTTLRIAKDIVAIHERDIKNFRNSPDFDLIFFSLRCGKNQGRK